MGREANETNCGRQGQSRTEAAAHARCAWQKAEKAMDAWQEQEQVWHQTKQALQLSTPAGALHIRAQAEAVLAETWPQLPDSDFAKAKRQLQQPDRSPYGMRGMMLPGQNWWDLIKLSPEQLQEQLSAPKQAA